MEKYKYVNIKAFDSNNHPLPVIGILSTDNTLEYIGMLEEPLNEMIKKHKTIDKLIISPTAVDMFSNKNNPQILKINKLGRRFLYNVNVRLHKLDLSMIRITINHIIIESGIPIIDEYAFSSATVKEVTWPQDHEVIPKGAFQSCTQLKKINGIENVTKIEAEAFAECVNLIEFNWPESCSEIPNYCFYLCRNLKRFSISRPDIKIGKMSFFRTGLETFDASRMLLFEASDNSFPEACNIIRPFYIMQ